MIQCKRLLQLPPLNQQCNNDPAAIAAGCVSYTCVQLDDCFQAVVEGRADLAVADPVLLHLLDVEYGSTAKAIAPILSEQRGSTVDRSCGTGCGKGHAYKAVAIVPADMCRTNPGFTLRNAKGLRSCHGKYGDLAGWVIPVNTLLQKGLATAGNDIKMVTSFFSESCAPSNGKTDVCSACGKHEQCNLRDRFAGSNGVLECLRSDSGDIGFVDHWTALGSGLDGPTGAANAKDFRVVCNYGCEELAKYDQPGCSLADVPGDVIFARQNMRSLMHIKEDFVQASNSTEFLDMFGPANNWKGILFSEGTDSLAAVHQTVLQYLGPLALVLDEDLERGTLKDYKWAVRRETEVRRRRGQPNWAIAVTFFVALIAGLAAGAGIMKLWTRRQRTQGYVKDTDAGGLPSSPGKNGNGVMQVAEEIEL